MTQLEKLTRGATIKGILPNENVTAIDVKWHGNDVVELTYKDAKGQPYTELIFRDREPTLEIVSEGGMWSFDGDGALLRLVSEAHRIRLAHLFDPLLAVHTSLVEPLPHQITAVYGEMLTRQPLRYLLADDPGAGKTIMAGLFVRELLIRGDLQRCLIVCPGSLAVQWQDELAQKFHLPFEILTNDRLESARTGNALAEMSLVIVRLDKLSRSDELQVKLKQTDWDLIICDEAHKMSASFFGGEIKETKRYKLGKLLSTITRHFLLMTATPHNGKDRKWEELSKLLCDEAEMFDAGGHRRKLVIFTEHRDTLNYLRDRIQTLVGCPESVVTIHGGMGREERKKAEEAFKQDAAVQVLIATDAAGEGINLQRAHLMVNYDLPWNPNRLEQRFGRIHRIGQTEICHLWNLVAQETREGDVYFSLLKKLEIELKALGGKVFDVLGVAIAGKELRELLVEAIRYGDRPEVRAS